MQMRCASAVVVRRGLDALLLFFYRYARRTVFGAKNLVCSTMRVFVFALRDVDLSVLLFGFLRFFRIEQSHKAAAIRVTRSLAQTTLHAFCEVSAWRFALFLFFFF
jgi:hypothetical protein